MHHDPRVLIVLLLASPTGLLGAAPASDIEPAPPLMAWTLDEGEGSVTVDWHSQLLGTLEGFGPGLWPAPGPFAYSGDSCLGFDGVDNRVVVHDSGVLAGRSSSSVSAWFKLPSGATPRQHVIYSERDACDFNVFWVGVELRPGVPSGLTFGIYDTSSPVCGSGSWHVLTVPILPADGTWHHVVATLHPSAGMTLYLDGVPVGSTPGVPPYMGGTQGASTIGHAHLVGHPAYFIGHIDEVGLFDHALAPPEVSWLFHNSLSDLPVPVHGGLCYGDGSGTSCPCGNESAAGTGGCENSGSVGARLTAAGSARLSFDTLYLSAVEMPENTPCLFFQGTTAVAGGAGSLLGDGLRCAGGSVVRLGVHISTSHYDWYPHVGEEAVSIRGLVGGGGGERYYQAWYRDPTPFCTPAGFNTTNAVRVVWTP